MVNLVWLTLALVLVSASAESLPFLPDLGDTPNSTIPSEPPRLLYGRLLVPVTKDLTTYKPIRILVNNSTLNLNPATTTLLMTDVIPAVLNFFNHTLSVHPYLAAIPMWGMTTCNGVTIPSADQVLPGWTGDMMIYLSSSVQASGFGTQDVCSTDPNVGNPIASGMILNKSFMESAGRNDMFHAVMYLFGQALGFGSGLYLNARKNGYQLYASTDMFKNVTDDFGNPVQLLITPTVASYAKLYLTTVTYLGVEITNRSKTIEWSSRAMLNDIMSSSPLQSKIYFSTISLAWFQDLGWYLVDFSMGANPIFGAGDSAFQETTCVSATGNPAFPEFCTATPTLQCDDSLLFKGNCTTPTYLGGCPVVQDIIGSGSCLNSNNAVLGAELEEWCPECRCFQGTHTLQAAPVPSRAICQRVICAATGAQVSVGGNLISCPINGGSVTIPGLLGQFQCPPFSNLCPTYGCPKDCSGFGKCLQGTCQCFPGRYGNDCSNTIGIAVLSIVGTTTTCITNAAYSAPKCNCNAGYYYDYISKTCLPCNPFCATCGITANICLTCPATSNSALVGATGTACICNAGYFRDSVSGKCLQCDTKCTSCSTSSTNCQSCQTGFLLTANNQCTCPWGTFQNSAIAPVGCSKCPQGCLACVSASLCSYCANTYTLINGACQCASGQYIDSTTLTCKPCYSSCSSCSGQANTCTSPCPANFVLDTNYKVCAPSNFKSQQFPLTNTTWMNSDLSYQFECVEGPAPRDFCKPLARIGLWFDIIAGYYLLQPNKFTPNPIVLPPAFLFSAYIRPGSNNAVRCILGKTRLGTSEAQILSFCLNPDNTVSLSAKLRSLDLASLGADVFIKIQTVIQLVNDRWAALKFSFLGGTDYLGRPGTFASILIDQTVYQQTFFPTAIFEDIIDMSDQRFVLGGVWSGGAVQNRFYGYIGEVAITTGTYPAVVACGCMKCTGYMSSCLSDCGFLYNDTPQNTCVLNQS